MPQRFTNPVIKYTTDTLKTLPGALLYFYENGTSTPKVVYQDIVLTNPHTNPVAAYDNGNFPPIFLDGTYRVELKNAAGVPQPQWPVDNVGGEEIEGQFDAWSSVTSYQAGALVTASNGLRYQATSLQPNLNQEPSISPTYWEEVPLFSSYNALSRYNQYARVLYSGAEYESLQNNNIGNTPASTGVWWRKLYDEWIWNDTKAYALGEIAFIGETKYISQAGSNTNHNPAGDTGEWWRPSWQEIPALIANYLSGGGIVSAYRDNFLTDAGAYTLPLAASVPIYTKLVISMLDLHKAFQPTVTISGSDLIRRAAGTDTVLSMQQGQKISITLVSNGVDEWMV